MNYITIAFLSAIITVFLAGLTTQVATAKAGSTKPRSSNFSRATPNLLTTIGVFGTFVGILIGLQNFDVSNVDESVPHLLEGLKTAFWTSVAGLGLSIVFKILQSFITSTEREASTDPIELLQALHLEAKAQTKALVGEEDSSLITQVQKFRTTYSDKSDELKKELEAGFEKQINSFDKFAKEMAENNSKALIEALNNVIKDFNEKLTEQFGENFKELNVAVGRLLEWQEKYKIHIESSEARLTHISEVVERASQKLTEAASALETMPAQAQKTAEITDRLNSQISIASDLAMGVQTLRENLKGAMPEINANINQLTTDFSQHVKSSSTEIQNSIEAAGSQLSNGSQRLEQLTNELFEAFDKSMQSELQRALEIMGKQLASISEKLATDYGNVANSISDVASNTRGV